MLRYWLLFLAILQTLMTLGLADSSKDRAINMFINRVSQCLKDVPVSVAAFSEEGQYSYYDTVSSDQGSKFCIGGATQAFTAVLLSKLLEENKNFTWDTPIQRIIGRLLGSQDPYVDENLNLKDILSMRSGLAGMDIVPIAKPFKDLDETLRHIRFAPQVKSFRDSYVYNEVLFAYVEEVLRKLGNDTWANLIKTHVLEPLRMSETVFITDADNFPSTELVFGIVYYNGQKNKLSLKSFDGLELVAPAAALCTTSSDMLKWLKFILGNTRQILSREALEMTFKPAVPRNQPNENLMKEDLTNSFETVDNGYIYTRDYNSLGWIKGQYRGRPFISQDGSLPGYQTLSTIIPSKKVAVYTSFPGDESYRSYLYKSFINQYVLDILLGVEGSWIKRNMGNLCTLFNELSNKLSPTKPNKPRLSRVKANDIEDYEGYYYNYAFGQIIVARNATRESDKTKSGQTLYLTYGMITYEMRATSEHQTFNLLASDTYNWYSTNADFYHEHRKIFAIFDLYATDEDGESAKSVTIQGFDKNIDVLFSTNAKVPKVAGWYCNAAGHFDTSTWLLILGALIFLR